MPARWRRRRPKWGGPEAAASLGTLPYRSKMAANSAVCNKIRRGHPCRGESRTALTSVSRELGSPSPRDGQVAGDIIAKRKALNLMRGRDCVRWATTLPTGNRSSDKLWLQPSITSSPFLYNQLPTNGEIVMKKLAFGNARSDCDDGVGFRGRHSWPRYTKAPAMTPVAVYNWTGCYIGGNLGGGWERTRQTQVGKVDGSIPGLQTTISAPATAPASSAAVRSGCDYQFSRDWLIGVQAMYDYGRLNSSHVLPTAFVGVPPGRHVNSVRTSASRDMWTVTGSRIGYLFVPQLLGYVKGRRRLDLGQLRHQPGSSRRQRRFVRERVGRGTLRLDRRRRPRMDVRSRLVGVRRIQLHGLREQRHLVSSPRPVSTVGVADVVSHASSTVEQFLVWCELQVQLRGAGRRQVLRSAA